MAERAAFLARVAAATTVAVLPEVAEDPPAVTPPRLPTVDLVERFAEALAAVDGVVHMVAAAEVAQRVVELLGRAGAKTAVMWDDEDLGVDGLRDAVASAGTTVVSAEIGADRVTTNRSLGEVHAGVTGATAGLAESGSIVLASGPGRPRMASLVPPLHIAIVGATAMHHSLAHFLVARPESVSAGANLVVITGPSRTGDIEMELNLGVHGPRYLHVLVVAP